MNYGCRVDDYRVTIGQVECTDLDLATNQLACKPPARQPDADPLQGSSDGIPHVTVCDVILMQINSVFISYAH